MNNSAAKKVFFNKKLLIGKRKVWGFTLLEMLVVLAIMAIIATLILVRFREGQKIYVLSQAAQKLAGDLREAQNMAVIGAEITGQPLIGGFGIYINNATSYALFLNTASNQADGCPSPAVTGSSPPDSDAPAVIIKTVSLPGGITIDNSETNVFFAPPRPLTCIDNGSENKITYILTQDSGGQTSVVVDKYGVINIE